MAGIEKLNKSKEYKNYKSIDAALSVVGQSLEPFTVKCVTTVHQKISQKLGVQQQCNRQCSQNIQNHYRWCRTCSAWKRELMKYLKNPREKLKWNKMKSWKWPLAPEEIKEVFLPGDWKMKDINFKDLSTVINVWKRCTEVSGQMVNGIDPLRKLRNEFAHKYSSILKIADNEMQNKFYTIFNVLNLPDIQAAIPAYDDLLKTLKDLEMFGMETNVENALSEIQSTLEGVLEEKKKKNKARAEIQKTSIAEKRKFMMMTLAFIMIPTAICVLKFYPSTVPGVSEVPFRLDISNVVCQKNLMRRFHTAMSECLVTYLTIGHFVSRQWLFERLEELVEDTSKKQGVILMADMGFGKTAAVANIVCATPSDRSFNLRKRLIAYHICRFDSIITKRPFVFIRRLASLIAQSIPMFSDLLKYKYTSCLDIFDAETCANDPYGCFDECVINPLRSMPAPSGTSKIVIIDALDECEHYHDGKIKRSNEIASLLKYKIHLFPKWFIFVLTCRNVLYCRQLGSSMHVLKLDSSDIRNINDIKTLLSTKGFNETAINANHESSNFLLVFSILSTNASFEQLQSLNMFYEQQFKRFFDIKYKHAKAILEIICSSFHPISDEEMLDIVSNATDIHPDEYEWAMRHLIHFLKSIDDKVHIMHVSLKEWLLEKENIDFKIDLSIGHYFNALHLWKLLRDKREKIDMVTFVSHAASANMYMKVNMLDKFSSLNTKDVIKMDINKDDYPLHRLAKQTDNGIAAKYLLRHFPETDRLDKQNVTPAFLAASFGNINILKVLTDAGANVNFRTKSFEDIIHLDLAAQMSFEKFHWDYGILDISVQNGHYNIVKFILKYYQRLHYPIDKRNGMNLLPVQLACKLGHIDIVKYIYERYQRMVNNTCLYYAADKGHRSLVDYLLSVNIKDDCTLCGRKLHWIPKGKIRIQGQMIVSNFQRRYQSIYVLYDDWHFIACETALHVAVRRGYVGVVNAFLDRPTISSYRCVDRGGRTPLVSAIQYNHTDIVHLFISKNLFRGNAKCARTVSLSDISQLHENERTILKSYFCPYKFSVMHIVAKYNRLWVVNLLQQHNITPKWDIRDSEGCFPVHTAACHESKEVLKYQLDTLGKESQDYKCSDGKSLLETAAKCSSFASVRFILRDSNINVSALRKSVVLATLSKSMGSSFAANNLGIESNISEIIKLFLNKEDDMMLQYEQNRNILHITLLCGHYQVASDMFLKYSKAAVQLMSGKDSDNYTPLRLAVSNLENATSFLYNSSNDTTMETSKYFLTAEDYAILISLDFVEKNNLISAKERKLILLELIEKNRVSLVSTYFRLLNKIILQDQDFIEKVFRADYTYFLTFDILCLKLLDVQRAVLNKFLCNISCTKSITNCHLHTLALKFGQLFSVGLKLFGEDNSDLTDKVILTFFPDNQDLLNSCYDAEGYNVLERAIQGGSARLVEHLVKIGAKSKRGVTDLIHFAINPSYRSKIEKYFILGKPHLDGSIFVKLIDKNHIREDISQATRLGYGEVANLLLVFFKNHKFVSFPTIPRSYNDIDRVVSLIISKGHTSIKKDVFCPGQYAQTFSLVHIFAMHGMSLTLANISHFWGSDVLNCRTFHSVTPMYLANSLQQQSSVGHLFQSMSFKKVYPKKSEEKEFIFHFLSRFLFKMYGNKDMKCIFRYKKHMPRNMYTILKAFICFSKFAKIIGERNNLKEDLSFVFSNYMMLVTRKVCTFEDKKRLRGLMSVTRYLDLLTRLDGHMVNVLNFFLKRMDNSLKFDQNLYNAKKNLQDNIEYIQNNPSFRFSGSPNFCEYPKSQNWGYLRNQFRFLVKYLKLKLMLESLEMVRNTLFFNNRLKIYELTDIAPYMRFVPAFRYVKEIDNLPFFEDTYLLYLKLTSTDKSSDFIDQCSKVVVYSQWNKEGERLMHEYLHS